MQSEAIRVKGLQKSYKKLHLLKNVAFTVQKGHIFALLGSNGAGILLVSYFAAMQIYKRRA